MHQGMAFIVHERGVVISEVFFAERVCFNASSIHPGRHCGTNFDFLAAIKSMMSEFFEL